jgi:DNA mismatch repair protein MutS
MSQLTLLWPDGTPTPTWIASKNVVHDLELDAIVRAMTTHQAYREAVRTIALQLCLDNETIRYRQTVLADLQTQPQLASAFEAILPLLDDLTQFTYRQVGRGDPLQEVLARARELELLVEIVQQLGEAYASLSTPLNSGGLLALGEHINALTRDSHFQEMARELPGLLDALRAHASITIGVNLDHRLRPEAAVLLSVNDTPFTASTLFERLLGKNVDDEKGIAPLHRPPVVGGTGDRRQGRLDPLMVPLFKDLSKVLEKVSLPIARELKKYVQINGRFLADLRPEIIFFVQALFLIHKLQAAGMPLTFPRLTPMDDRLCHVKSAYNLQLALQKMNSGSERSLPEQIITNDIDFGPGSRIAILTGPNQGGKTTYMQSVGLVQLLAQIGLPVPGQAAEISPVDAIFTHYPVEEQLELGTGRFGDEARRIRTIFEDATRHSLVLLNESLSTTSPGEGLHIARDIVRALRWIGLRAIFTTHLHELAEYAPRINADTPGDSLVFSLVASRPDSPLTPDQPRHTYHIHPGPPIGRSYADQIASRYGISGPQLESLLKDRNLL